ncbi:MULTISPECIES: NAD-dependent epimerase/dehydratase family protein [unclassified Anaerobiospirillum]|uniref:NAD-dependent epimerase/dehydratase family protein n=1 Tax=unclassified Anaerobiospirillum TaxID=2647410 RepID=UPI001FF46E5E|nr:MULTISPECIES: NAD-dependent epimerase/dehydratase family protein [unclassified Anaerobiospirillum]MCK0534266.1 NAD-dependent epimerase/dehydratase family protein [Anaerobiospirillum sp. NML120511]MCK0539535.1 NAD-dependent epimerase/dehydratase family protein [Anaerobiospirillum sp. NML02-A-032]
MKILITGVAGFIGMHLCRRLCSEHEITGIDNLSGITYEQSLKIDRLSELGLHLGSLEADHLKSGQPVSSECLTFCLMDLCDRNAVGNLIAEGGFDLIINLAALAGVRLSSSIPDQYMASNVTGFFNILESLRELKLKAEHDSTVKCPRLIFASSSSVYGECSEVPFSESNTDINPVSVYAATKKIDETLARTYASLFKIDSIALRFFTVYGPFGRPDMAPFIFTRKLHSGQPIHLFNHGRQRRDYTYIDDIVEGIAAIAQGPDQSGSAIPFDVFNIGNGSPVDLGDFVSTLEEISGIRAQVILDDKQLGDVDQTWADVSRLMEKYHFRPHTTLKEGLTRFYQWYLGYYGRK